MECIICDKKYEKNILYENDDFTIMLAVEPSTNGHIQIFSKNHYTILEQVPDETLGKMMAAANKISMLLFELLKVHGTNIIANNGVPAGQKIPHFSIDIIPRRTDDNLKIDWALKPANPEALDSVHRIIEEGISAPESKPIFEDKPKEIPAEKSIVQEQQKNMHESDKDKRSNYYHKLFERIP